MTKQIARHSELIAIEGVNGVGKTTHARKLVDALSFRYPDRAFVFCQDPDSVLLGEQTRRFAVRIEHYGIDPVAQSLLYAAARRQLTVELIRPALTAGKTVIVDRNTVPGAVFQHMRMSRRGYSEQDMESAIATIDEMVADGLRPSLNILLNPINHALDFIATRPSQREAQAREGGDAHMTRRWDYQAAMAERYLELAERNPGEWQVIDFDPYTELDNVAGRVLQAALRHLRPYLGAPKTPTRRTYQVELPDACLPDLQDLVRRYMGRVDTNVKVVGKHGYLYAEDDHQDLVDAIARVLNREAPRWDDLPEANRRLVLEAAVDSECYMMDGAFYEDEAPDLEGILP